MMILAYDHRGIITTDRVPRGTGVTAAYYRDWTQKLCRKMHKNRPDLLGDRPLTLHDNARPHLEKSATDLLSKYEWEVLRHVYTGPPGWSTRLNQLNSAVERYRLHSSTKVNEAVDFKLAANELVPGRCCDMWLFDERMSTQFRKKEIRGKNDVLLVLHWGTGRDLLVDTGNVWW